jgi:hypothetical protein
VRSPLKLGLGVLIVSTVWKGVTVRAQATYSRPTLLIKQYVFPVLEGWNFTGSGLKIHWRNVWQSIPSSLGQS